MESKMKKVSCTVAAATLIQTPTKEGQRTQALTRLIDSWHLEPEVQDLCWYTGVSCQALTSNYIFLLISNYL